MILDARHKLNLLYIARGHWIDAEKNICAYQRTFEHAKRWSDRVKVATIISAALTTVSGFASIRWLTLVTGVLTTVLASSEKLFLNTENYKGYWKCRTGLAGVQSDLNNFPITLDTISTPVEGTKALDQMSKQVLAITQDNPIIVRAKDQESADFSFATAALARMIAQAERAADVPLTVEVGGLADLPEDAPAVVAAVRIRKGA